VLSLVHPLCVLVWLCAGIPAVPASEPETRQPPSEDADDGPVKLTDSDARRARAADRGRDVVPLLETHCFDCHGAEEQHGDLNLQALIQQLPLVRNARSWTNVIEFLRLRSMPPAEDADLDEADRRLLISWLRQQVDGFDYSQVDDPGYEPARRLTHQQYNHTVRDLFGVNLRPADRFPADLSGQSGFDNSANSLQVQSLLFERYLGAADAIVEAILSDRPRTEELQDAARRILSANRDQRLSDAKTLKSCIARLLNRAYRRDATPSQVDRAVAVFNTARGEGLTERAAMRRVLRQILVSPRFLMHLEENPNTAEAFRIGAWDLANRLSYFLWSTMPDKPLFDQARSGGLLDETVLRREVSRMLRDPRAETLGSVFAAQWFGFQHLGTRVRLDPIDNPWCTDSLMEAMKSESTLCFVELVRENQPLRKLIDADFTYLNQELAEHYEIEGVRGPQLRRVVLRQSRRGGIFGQGSVLAVTAFPGRTSPVVRGRWILTDVLGIPLPPPPPDADEFSEELEESRRLTVRQKLERHAGKASCRACHGRIDPLGLSLENFDWFGRWRTRVRGRRIEAEVRLPDGTEFEGPAGLKRMIVQQRMDDLAAQTTRKMLAFALGRQLEYYDEKTVRGIVGAWKQDDYRMQSLITRIVTSYPFQYKRNPRSTGPRE